MFSNDFDESTLVIIREDDGSIQPGWVMQYHGRGESELILGLVWLVSGKLTSLATVPMKIRGSLKRVHSAKDIPDLPDFKVFRSYIRRNRNSPMSRTRSFGNILLQGKLSAEMFSKRSQKPFMGKLNLSRSYKSLHSVLVIVEENQFIMKRRKNDEVRSPLLGKFLKDSLKGRTEGVWMNPTVSLACLKKFGIPKEYRQSGKKLVSDYNQMIFQIDGSDKARTLGMHRDRDENDKPVNTILGSIAGDGGKDVIMWLNSESVQDMPRWWRNEGMSRESFQLAKVQCMINPAIARQVSIFTIEPGFFLYMPKNTYHWVCPSDSATWTVMITSSTY